MSGIVQLSLALSCALAAAGLNWVYLASQTSPTRYVAIRNGLDQGDRIEAEDLVAIPVPGDPERLRTALIPYQNRSVLFGNRAVRHYDGGDMVFARDLLPPIDSKQWDVIGPFELISVAEQFKQPGQSRMTTSDSIGRNTVTIAVDAGFDRETSRLMDAIAEADSSTGGSQVPEIVAVQVVPSPSPNQVPVNQAMQRGEVVYQTVSLQGIPNVPGVLLEGDFIRFVVPRMPGT